MNNGTSPSRLLYMARSTRLGLLKLGTGTCAVLTWPLEALRLTFVRSGQYLCGHRWRIDSRRQLPPADSYKTNLADISPGGGIV